MHTRRHSWQPPSAPRELEGNTQLEDVARAAREASVDPLLDQVDDLAPVRPILWLVLTWVMVSIALALILGGCGGGVDTPDEFMGPPVESGFIKPPRPCPIDFQCQPDPFMGEPS